MKILFITPWYPDEERPNSGIFIRQQAVALAVKNSVTVVAIKVNYKDRAFSKYTATKSFYEGVEEHRLVVSQSLPLYNQINFLRIALQFCTLIGEDFKPDIIHASIAYPGAVVGWRLSERLKVPFVFTEHTRPQNNFRSWWHRWTSIAAMKRASQVMAVSNALAKEMAPLIDQAPVVVPNIVDTTKYENVIPSNDAVWQIGFIGGMNTAVKGLDILLKAVAEIDRPFFLHICGDGLLMPDYKLLAEELGLTSRCKFYGFIDPAAMPQFFSRLHFVVCASRYETFNVSLVEAMACGLPVVSTKCGGPEDFVNENNGILCEKENPAALREAIEKICVLYAKFSLTELKNCARQFRAAPIFGKLETIYKRALASAPNY